MLEKIIKFKREEVKKQMALIPVKKLETSLHFNIKSLSLVEYLNREGASGIIAEIKRKSPSKGMFNEKINVEKLSISYMQAGASALSVLTDKEFFGGTNQDLLVARKYNLCPILRKDFVISEYQIYEAKAIGADIILLIASVLTKEEIKDFSVLAKSLGLEVLLEVHTKEETRKYCNEVDLIGVNNRDLGTFKTDIQNSVNLVRDLPDNACKISESGIRTAEDILELKKLGFKGFLIGETFMKTAFPGKTLNELVSNLNKG